MSSSPSPGHPVRVISLEDTPNLIDGHRHLQLDKRVLTEISEGAGPNPIIVIAIGGAAGGGKSLILSYVVRYLLALEKSENGTVTTGDWLDPQYQPVSLKGTCFPFKNSLDRSTTTGLWMWSRPFIVRRGLETVAILLMDTEGWMDPNASEIEQSPLIGLALLASSTFIFNEHTKLNESSIAAMAHFIKFGQLAAHPAVGKNSFQNLIFLIRDWKFRHFIDFGGEDEQTIKFIQNHLQTTSKMTNEAAQNRQSIRKCFQTIGAYLMPHPGETALSENFLGSIRDVTEGFRDHVVKFVESLIKNSEPKIVNNNGGGALVNLMEGFVNNFNLTDIPSPISVSEAAIDKSYQSRVKERVQFYMDEMREKIQKNSFMGLDRLKRIHIEQKNKAITAFQTVKGFHDQKHQEDFGHRLVEKIDEAYIKLSLEMEEEQQGVIRIAEQQGCATFELVLVTSLSQNRSWLQAEFEELADKAAVLGLTKFLEACSFPSDSVCSTIVPPFMTKLEKIQDSFWSKIQEQNQLTINQIMDLAEEFKNSYRKSMEILLDDNFYMQPVKLGQRHDKYFQKFFDAGLIKMKVITTMSQGFLIDQSQKFQHQLNSVFDEISVENEKKLNDINAKARIIIKNALEMFQVRAAEIVITTQKSPNPEPLEALQKLVLRDTVTLLERAVPQLSIYKPFEKQLKDTLNEAVQRCLLLKMTQNLHQKEEEATCLGQSYQKRYSQQMKEYLKEEKYWENDQQLQKLCQKTAQQCRALFETELSAFNFPSDHSSIQRRFLKNFDDFVITENGRLVDDHELKKEVDEIKAAKTVRNSKLFYHRAKTDMDIEGQMAWLNLDEIIQAHHRLSSETLEFFRASNKVTPYHLSSRYERILEEWTMSILDDEKAIYKSRLSQIHQVVDDTAQNLLDEYEMSVLKLFEINPWILPQDFLMEQRPHFQNAVEKYEKEINKVFHGSHVNIINLIDEFKQTLLTTLKFFENHSKTVQQNGVKLAQQFDEECLSHFSNSLKSVLSKPNITQDEFQHQTDLLIRNTITNFETKWPLPSGELKRKTLSRLRREMALKVKAVEERQVAKQNDDALRILNETLSSLCPHLDDLLEDGEFFRPLDLQTKFHEACQNATQKLQKGLATRGINLAPDLKRTFEEKVESKKSQISHLNSANMNSIKMEIEMFLQQKPSIKNRVDLETFRNRVRNNPLAYAMERCKINPDHLQQFQELIETSFRSMYDQIVEDLKKNSEENESQIMEMALRIYNKEMTDYLGDDPTFIHPDKLSSFHRASIQICVQQIEDKHIIISDPVMMTIFEWLDNSFRIYQEKNKISYAKDGNLAIGIDLGTTTSCVAIYQNDKPFVIRDDCSRKLIPSYVYFPQSGNPIVGEEAKDAAQREPENTVFDAKRLIGRSFSDDSVQEDIKKWPFDVIDDGDNKPAIVVRGKEYQPEEISAQVLMKMKEIAENFLRHPVTKAVITVPANFSDSQRDSTRQAAQIAGLEVLQIINEPTAAAMAHAITWKDEERIVLVFDFGGGTFDVTILKSGVGSAADENEDGGQNLKVLSTLGDMHLGGEDFDSNMMTFCAAEFEKLHGVQLYHVDDAVNVGASSLQAVKRRLRRLRNECEKAKRHLAVADVATVSMDAIYDQLDLTVVVTRRQFDEMNQTLFQGAIDIVQRALEAAKVDKREVTDVLLVGGSSRIPRVRQMIQELLVISSISIDHNVHLQEAVALGASVQACILNGGAFAATLPKVRDVQPFSLGIELKSGKMAVIIPRHTAIPTEASDTFVTTKTNQSTVDVVIFSGEAKMVAENDELGSFVLSNIPPGAAGSQKILVHMAVDANGILNVTATCVGNGESKQLLVKDNRRRLTEEQVQELRARARGSRT